MFLVSTFIPHPYLLSWMPHVIISSIYQCNPATKCKYCLPMQQCFVYIIYNVFFGQLLNQLCCTQDILFTCRVWLFCFIAKPRKKYVYFLIKHLVSVFFVIWFYLVGCILTEFKQHLYTMQPTFIQTYFWDGENIYVWGNLWYTFIFIFISG